jgi:beta-lactamase regulating signal transducer with metallopeptidase domain
VNLLLDLSLRGSVAVMLVLLLDRSMAGRISTSSRRLWWCLIPLGFLVPVHIPMIPALANLPADVAIRGPFAGAISAGEPAFPVKAGLVSMNFGVMLWLAGAAGYLALVSVQTARASRRWSRERLSTDHVLLELLEDCKVETGVTAPIGLVISNSVPSPAILGWMRPRILLPASLAASAGREELRPILLHELAHFRWLDVPFNWLLTLVRAAHWFNPLSHLGAGGWARFREEAADEAAMRSMRDESSHAYGDALVRSLRDARRSAAPFGSFAIIESVNDLKRRLTMINRYHDKSPRLLLTLAVSLLLASVIASISARAADGTSSDPRVAVSSSAQAWLKEIDDGHYAQSWKDASSYFQAS